MLIEHQITSSLIQNPRRVWIQQSLTQPAIHCCFFLDAEFYMERVKAPEIISNLQQEGYVPSLMCVYLSHGDAAMRHTDFTCNATFVSFLVDELLPWLESTTHSHTTFYLCGLSLSGLSAVFTAARSPHRFAGVLAQSPSAWWNDEWLSTYVRDKDLKAVPFWISVGDQETSKGVFHPPSGLFQKTSQIESCHRLADSLAHVSTRVHYREFEGGHDTVCWALDLPLALTWFFGGTMGLQP